MPGKNMIAGGLFLASVGCALLAWAPSGSSYALAGTADVPGASAESGTLTCTQLESLWREAGGSAATAHMAAQIATAESSGDQYSTDYDSNGTVDRGYWQINSIWGPESTFDPLGNAKAAVAISGNGSNWGPWVTYQNRHYIGKC
jgi:hypothetical protein